MLAFAKEAASSEQAEPKKGGDSTCTGDGDGNDDTTPSSPSPSTSSTTKAANDRRRRSLRFDFSVPGVTSISVDVHKFDGQPHTFVTADPDSEASKDAIVKIREFVLWV